MKKIALLFVFAIISISGFSQALTHFTRDSTAFLDELTDLLSSGNKNESEAIMYEFINIWITEYYSEEDKSRIIDVCDFLLKRRVQAFPYFSNYVTTLIAFAQNEFDKQSYLNWEKGLKDFVNAETISVTNINNLFVQTIALLTENLIYKGPSITWGFSPTNVLIEYDTEFYVSVDVTNLTCKSAKDSIMIYQTYGIYYPLTRKWVGADGTVNWERVGLSRDFVNAKLTNYQIDMTNTQYVADSVLFSNLEVSKEPLLGRFEEKIVHHSHPETIPFPKFDSYKEIEIKNIYPNIDYKGGYSLHGTKFIGSGTKERKAHLRIYKGDTTLMDAYSQSYIFGGNQVNAVDTEVSIRLGTDSIYHPNLKLKYILSNRHIALIRNIRDKSQMWYFDSYHKFNLDAEMLVFPIDSSNIYLTDLPGAANHKARFKSYNFFSLKEFNDKQMMDEINPIAAVRLYHNKNKTTEFHASDLAKLLKRQLLHVHHMLIRLYYDGFIEYNIKEMYGKILPKTEHYILARKGILSYRNNYDYDVIEMKADTSLATPTGILNLKTYDMDVFGVDSFTVAMKKTDEQCEMGSMGAVSWFEEQRMRKDVTIKPADQKIILKENRDIVFDGVLQMENFVFHGKDYYFDYDSFRIDLRNVEYLKMHLPEKDENGEIKRKPNGEEDRTEIKHKIENIKGYVFLDSAQNKSGDNCTPAYPKFASLDTSFVHYSDSSFQDINYDEDKFKFKVDPYVAESLYSFNTDNWSLTGTLKTSGIVPDMRETIRVKRDSVPGKGVMSGFGFDHDLDAKGIPIYNGKGTLYSYDSIPSKNLKLGLMGLRGQGKVDYLTSTTKSKDFKLFQDSLVADTGDFINKIQETPFESPSAFNKMARLYWVPHRDSMVITSLDEPFKMYYKEDMYLGDSLELVGYLTLTPKGLSGNGRMFFKKAMLTSKKFDYKNRSIDADTANFNLRSIQDTSISVFDVQNVLTHVNLVNRKGTFKTNDPANFATFPQNEYIANMQEYTWHMDDRKVDLHSTLKRDVSGIDTTGMTEIQKEDLTLEGSKMISTAAGQDSVNFMTTYAEYDIEQKLITADPVKLIRIADATIYPSTPVVIEEQAKIRTLNNSQIIANNENRLHNIINATVNIFTRHDYSGSGTYEYMNESFVPQSIQFESIYVQDGHTMASGDISQDDGFMLSPSFKFQGKANLNAGNKYLLFKGVTEMVHNCNIGTEKFAFEARINPMDVKIPVADSVLSVENEKLFTAIFMTQRSPEIYTSFLNRRKYYSDQRLISAGGFVIFDKETNEYVVAELKKLNNRDLPGNLVSLNIRDCKCNGEGKIDLNVDLGQVKTQQVGFIEHELIPDKVSLDILMTLDFFFAKKSIDVMLDAFEKNTTLKGINISYSKTVKKLSELVNKRRITKILKDAAEKGEINIPKELEHTFTFTTLKFNWNPETRSYRSTGNLGLLAIENQAINKFVEGFVEIIKRRSGDMINIYFKLDKKTWFFFTYTEGQMLSVSSLEDFNLGITEMKAKHRKLKTDRKETPYEFNIAESSLKNRFLRRFLSDDEMQDYDEEKDEYNFGDEEEDQTETPIEENNNEITPDDKEKPTEDNKKKEEKDDIFDDEDG